MATQLDVETNDYVEIGEWEPTADQPFLLGLFIGTFGVIGIKIFNDDTEGDDNVGWCLTFVLLGMSFRLFGLRGMGDGNNQE